jgi:hypothetical protein
MKSKASRYGRVTYNLIIPPHLTSPPHVNPAKNDMFMFDSISQSTLPCSSMDF